MCVCVCVCVLPVSHTPVSHREESERVLTLKGPVCVCVCVTRLTHSCLTQGGE